MRPVWTVLERGFLPPPSILPPPAFLRGGQGRRGQLRLQFGEQDGFQRGSRGTTDVAEEGEVINFAMVAVVETKRFGQPQAHQATAHHPLQRLARAEVYGEGERAEEFGEAQGRKRHAGIIRKIGRPPYALARQVAYTGAYHFIGDRLCLPPPLLILQREIA